MVILTYKRQMNENRIQYIDGMRGIAILSVVFYHAYSRWGTKEPFDQTDILVNLFSYGWLGVHLFFSISGYVIYKSIQRSDNFFMFASARYLRLAPSMFVAAILIYISSFIIPERPLGKANIADFLPSLTFVGPGLISKITGLDVKSLDGAFWSLYVEVKFYFVIAIVFFVFKDKRLNILLFLYLGWIVCTMFIYFQIENNLIETIHKILSYLGVNYYGWFLLGIYTYRFQSESSITKIIIWGLISTLAAFTTDFGNVGTTLASSMVALFFLLAFVWAKLRVILSSKFFLFFGFISYPLYLLHQNIVTGLSIKLFNYIEELPTYIYPIPFLIIVMILSYLIAKLEPVLKNELKKLLPKNALGFNLKR